ncbi:DUF616 domain-containing protein [Mesorhizobium sp. AR07]|uniref:DUF616 domain-containing protein n=1 Tax=Mesorhizobium sp. AR07 TaxID=2865838 RepID=UPI00215DE93C|nr:DUF616 domain-containing protein [Mesorhizobium sp. AR07]UVK46102.1 DUF616 domain-containing protein [Mesorhizobium sp. AR07]
MDEQLHAPTKRRVVYTCLFGYSEKFADAEYESDGRTDFVCFTDDKSLHSKIWNFRYIDADLLGPVRVAKMVKILAHRFLGNYEASLYLNNTAMLNSPISTIFDYLRDDQSPMICFQHSERSCIYAEAEAVIALEYDNAAVIREQMSHYQRIGHPVDGGLIFGGVLLRRHNDIALRSVMEQWFYQVCRYSYRDQLSFNAVARKMAFTPNYFPGNISDGKLFRSPLVPDSMRLPRGFSDNVYLDLHEDVRLSGMNPREHYLKHGMAEGRPYRPVPRPE